MDQKLKLEEHRNFSSTGPPLHCSISLCVAGLGVSLCYIATSEILAFHFDKYNYLAFSIGAIGYYVGMSVIPSLSEYLLNDLGYSKAMAILSTIHITHVVSGILFYQPSNTIEGNLL